MTEIFPPVRSVAATDELRRRRLDLVRIGILGTTLLLGLLYPSASVWAQSQDAINATLNEQVRSLTVRLDKIENMVFGVLLLIAGQIIAQVVQIKRSPEGRR